MASSPDLTVWRLVRPEHAPGIDGEGARLWGGRWNSPGVPVVYTASSLALAVLEYLVHVPLAMRRAEQFPELVAVRLTLPEAEVAQADARTASADAAACQRQGDAWLAAAATPVLAVRSAVVPQERNYLLNPRHAALRVEVAAQEPFRLDPRLAAPSA